MAVKALLTDEVGKEIVKAIKDNTTSVAELAELKNTCNELKYSKANKTDLASPYNFKGSCLSTELPTEAKVNDTWYCTDLKYRVSWNGSIWCQSSLNESDYEDEFKKYRPQKPFGIRLGAYSSETDSDDVAGRMSLFADYFDDAIFRVACHYENGSFINNDSKFGTTIKTLVGKKVDTLKFHNNDEVFVDLFNQHGVDTILNAYVSFVKATYDSCVNGGLTINNIVVLNEQMSILTSTYSQNIINAISEIRTYTGCDISISYTNAFALSSTSASIIGALDFVSLNLYPIQGFSSNYYKYSGIRDVVDMFNREFIYAQPRIQGKRLWITEFGCPSSFEAMNRPQIYKNGADGKVCALFIEGLFKSMFISNCERAYLWFAINATTYSPSTLLSIKNYGGVRYAD